MATSKTAPAGEVMGGKIAPKEMGFTAEVLTAIVTADKEADHFLYRCIGLASDTRHYTSKVRGKETDGFGAMGTFKGVLKDGTVKTGSACFLPGSAQSQLIAAIEQSGSAVEVACDIYARYEEPRSTSDGDTACYQYTVRALKSNVSQQLADLEKKLDLPAMPS